MRKLLFTIASLALAGSLAAEAMDGGPGPGGPGGPGMEQGGPGGQGMGMGPGGPGMGPGMGPEPGAEEPVEALKEKLDLSEAQVEKLRALRKKHREAMKADLRKMRGLMMKLSDQVEDKAPDAALEATLKEVKDLRQRLQDAREKGQAEREAVLTVQQRAKAALGIAEGMKGRMMDRREARKERREDLRGGAARE